MCQTNCWYDKIWVVHQEIVWSTHNIDTGMKENLTKLKEKSPCMQGEISRNMNTHQVHKYWIKGNYDKIMMIIITYLETVIPRYCKIHL